MRIFNFHHGLHHGGVFHLFVFAILLGLIVFGIVALVRTWSYPKTRFRSGGDFARTGSWTVPGQASDPALSELRMGYARGELSWEDYVRRAKNLGFPAAGDQGGGGVDPTQQRPEGS